MFQRKAVKKHLNLHLKIDETLVSLISDYHDVTPTEVIAFFYDKMKEAVKLPGNVVNKEQHSVRHSHAKSGPFARWSTVKASKDNQDPFREQYDAYALRGFYPGSKIPFKMSGVKHGDDYGYACFVVIIGDKNKEKKFSHKQLEEIQEAVVDSIILDTDPEKVEQPYKPRQFRTMTPKGMQRLPKDD